jgi:ribosomal protein S3AE
MPKQTKVVSRRKKFVKVEIPIIKSSIGLIGSAPEEVAGKTIKLDLTRMLKGKSVEAVVKVSLEKGNAVARPVKLRLMPYFIRRMIRKRISYVEDSFETPSQESMLVIKPFLITRKRVSRAIRKTLRNKAKNWIEDHIATRKDEEIFHEVLSNKLQKPLSLALKKTYPLSLCEIRILQIKRPLKTEEIPKVSEKPKKPAEPAEQLSESESAKKEAELAIKKTQEKASQIEDKKKPAKPQAKGGNVSNRSTKKTAEKLKKTTAK